MDRPFDVVALVTSAGGLDAISRVLRDLPDGFGAAVVVAQHLGGHGSTLVDILERRANLPVSWIGPGERLLPGRVYVCPPRRRLEVFPDRTCGVTPMEPAMRLRPLDAFLRSVASACGRRGIAVVLTGMGRDAADGARAVKLAGGTVLAQSEDTAEAPAMPHAAVATGAVDLVLPLHEIGTVLTGLAAGGRLPRPRSEVEAVEHLFGGAGEARRTLREVDWAATPLGPVSSWPRALRGAVRTALSSNFACVIGWGPERVQLYNDAAVPLFGARHPAQGVPWPACWPEFVERVGPQYEHVMRTGEAVHHEVLATELRRHGFAEEAFYAADRSPLYGDDDTVAGVLSTSVEITARVLSTRRLATLRHLTTALAAARTPIEVCEGAATALGHNRHDVPFALLYLVDGAHSQARLCAATGIGRGAAAVPYTIDVRGGHPAWPMARVLSERRPVRVDDLTVRFPGLHAGPWPESPRAALLLPLSAVHDDEAIAGVMVVGISPRLVLDGDYQDFVELLAHEVAAGLAASRSRQRERDRLLRVAELEHAKLDFFANVSNEFRTPLTLVLGPLEALAARSDRLPDGIGGDVDLAARNARRMLVLVDELLDFSRIGAGDLRPRMEPTDLARLTVDIATVFGDVAGAAGLTLAVHCAPLSEPVWVDRRMWEKIVSNLLSNAVKFTFDGGITVDLRLRALHAELTVRDTGVGIPPEEQPRLFTRFHRVHGTKARSHDGAGLGLALVNELVGLHQGRVRVRSEEGVGSSFTVWIPRGARPAADPVTEPEEHVSVAAALAEEAAHWGVVPAGGEAIDGPIVDGVETVRQLAPGSRVQVVAGNADLRDYLRRLLSEHWQVEVAPDADAALTWARTDPPDLIVADPAPPDRDGAAFVATARADPTLAAVPLILLTARPGEGAGADDHIAKPFSARELLVRVGAQLALSRVRREAADRLREQADYLRYVFDAAAAADFEIDVPGRQLRTSARLNALFGFPPEVEATLDDFESRCHPDEPEHLVAAVTRAGGGHFLRDFRIVAGAGTRWIHARGEVIVGPDGAVERVRGVLIDITDRKRTEEALLALNEELKRRLLTGA
ncbi:hypothetical protein Val02_19030 [Virgisporangium aliadipatigenens]|uniref:histidine kinase n=1 Tax=Virgisporangium aliadipatigenens TaxID=741659 RepID=A0A8J3YIG1_9ACTN|nr:chemotaxis protein CheB [Virgisporangium aliadipatigenens]GIJ45017.1 hypothetical protein Val02_19030 [Virgisporangium aliadipatigenens]